METEIINKLREVLTVFGYPENALKINPYLSHSPNYRPDAVLEVNGKIVAVFEFKIGSFENHIKIQLGAFDIDIPGFLVTLDKDKGIRIRRVLPNGSHVDSDVRELRQENLQKYYTNEIIEKETKAPNGSKNASKGVYIIFHFFALVFFISLIIDIINNSTSTCWMSVFSEIAKVETLVWSIYILVLILIPGYVFNKPLEKKILQAIKEVMAIFSSIR